MMINFDKLGEPFHAEDIEWRIQQSGLGGTAKPWGLCLAYVTNRAIMERLDSVCGPENWQNQYDRAPEGGILCGISVRVDGEWITKWDGAGNTDIEAVKGGLSNSMKRAAVQWKIGRYLYRLETGWANFHEKGKFKAKINGEYYNWDPPKLPAWALPESASMTTANFLGHMKGYAKAFPDEYKAVLDKWQIDSAKSITDPDSRQTILDQIDKATDKK